MRTSLECRTCIPPSGAYTCADCGAAGVELHCLYQLNLQRKPHPLSCHPCSAGYYCPNSTMRIECPKGHFCQAQVRPALQVLFGACACLGLVFRPLSSAVCCDDLSAWGTQDRRLPCACFHAQSIKPRKCPPLASCPKGTSRPRFSALAFVIAAIVSCGLYGRQWGWR